MTDQAIAVDRPPARRGRWLPLRAYLGALLVLFALTAVASIGLAAYVQEQNAIEIAQKGADFGAKLAAGDLSAALGQLQSTVTRTAAAPGLGPIFDSPNCTLTVGPVGPFTDVRLDLVRLDGSVRCSSAPATTSTSQAGAPWLRDPTMAMTLVGPVEDPVTKRMSVVSAAPVAGRGLVVAFADLSNVGPTLASRFGGPQALEFLITAADGRTVIARSIDPAKWIGANVGATPFGRAADPVQRSDVDGMERIYGSASVTGSGWIVYAGAGRDAALASARDLLREQLAITLLGILVLLIGSLLIYRAITAPLRRLSQAMGRGTSGLIRGTIVPSGPAEIAQLGHRFNALVGAVHAEIRERGRSEELAVASERNYRLLFAGNPQPLFVYDLDTLAFLEVNDAAVTRYGYTRDEFRAMTVASILTEDQLPGLASVKERPDHHRSGPWKHRTKDGTLIDVDTTSIRLVYDGRDARLVVVDDLTERRKLEHQLQQSQRLETVGQLAGGIAHDFNNLLAVILNYAEFVTDELPDGPLRHDVEEIQRAAMRAADLTRQLLIFARREATNPQVLDLNMVVGGVEDMLRRTLGEDIDLTLKLAENLPSVLADPGQIEQVFLNLTVNARDAMPAGGRVVVETSAVDLDDEYAAGRPGVTPGRYVRLSVSDTGMGMSADVSARAFEPFFTTKAAGRGTGLGLATVYGIVTQAGGNIGIYSEPGLGTRISIHLPATDEAAVRVRPSTEPVVAAGGAGRTVLIVEDESAVLLAAARILTGHGYKVLMRADPADALQVLGDVQKEIDVLLTDIVMPGISGIELGRRATELRPELPVLYMTGYSQEVISHRGALPADSNFLQKPFTRRDLLDAIAKTLDPARAG
jgi:PAS domain S-box-containing protein